MIPESDAAASSFLAAWADGWEVAWQPDAVPLVGPVVTPDAVRPCGMLGHFPVPLGSGCLYCGAEL